MTQTKTAHHYRKCWVLGPYVTSISSNNQSPAKQAVIHILCFMHFAFFQQKQVDFLDNASTKFRFVPPLDNWVFDEWWLKQLMIILLWPEWGRCNESLCTNTSSNLLYLVHPVLISYKNCCMQFTFENLNCSGEKAAHTRGWPVWALTSTPGGWPSRRGSWWPATTTTTKWWAASTRQVTRLTCVLNKKTESQSNIKIQI